MQNVGLNADLVRFNRVIGPVTCNMFHVCTTYITLDLLRANPLFAIAFKGDCPQTSFDPLTA